MSSPHKHIHCTSQINIQQSNNPKNHRLPWRKACYNKLCDKLVKKQTLSTPKRCKRRLFTADKENSLNCYQQISFHYKKAIQGKYYPGEQIPAQISSQLYSTRAQYAWKAQGRRVAVYCPPFAHTLPTVTGGGRCCSPGAWARAAVSSLTLHLAALCLGVNLI